MINVTVTRGWSDWSNGSLSIEASSYPVPPTPESGAQQGLEAPYLFTWRNAKNCRVVRQMTQNALNRFGINPDQVSWQHYVVEGDTITTESEVYEI